MGYIAFPQSYEGKKIIRIHETDTDTTVGATGSNYDAWYRYPASFLIPENDPQYSKEGNTAMGSYGYMLNSRCWSYDVGLSLLVFATTGDWDLVDEMLQRLMLDQNMDGSWNFSYDIYIGKLLHDYVRTGAMGWVLWGICYALLTRTDGKSKNEDWLKMVEKAGSWLLSKQVTDKTDIRYGLLRGGYGVYDNDYAYTDTEIEWCSVEHQCSALQALEGCALLLKQRKYKTAAELVRSQLYIRCYDKENGRFYQGVNGGAIDKAWALDCTTWAGTLIFSVVHSDCAKTCLATAKEVYLTENKEIVQSIDAEHFNTKYSSEGTFSGFKPYSDITADYSGAPDIVWTEGTLGYAALALVLGKADEAKLYVDECIRLQECDGSTGGVIYTTETFASLPWEFHVWESVVSSAWLYLVINNPSVLFPRVLRQVYYVAKISDIQDERTTSE